MGKPNLCPIEQEAELLGSILLVGVQPMECAVYHLMPEYFSDEGFQGVFEAMTDLYRAGDEIDIVTVVDKMLEQNPSLPRQRTAMLLSALLQRVPESEVMAKVHALAPIIYEKYLARELIKAAEEIVAESKKG